MAKRHQRPSMEYRYAHYDPRWQSHFWCSPYIR
jgi:hypothetical protein